MGATTKRAKRKSTTARPPRRPASTGGTERTVQLLKMADQLYWSVVLWSKNRSAAGDAVGIGQIYDEALAWFLDHEAKSGYDLYRTFPLRDAKNRALWIDSRLLERAGECAERDGVARNRVLYTAFLLYLKANGPVPTAQDIQRLKKIKSVKGQRGRPLSSDS
jgi:hypothetical protein